MATEFRDETDQGRWAMYVDGALVSVVDVRENDAEIAFPHTYTVPAHRGKGYAAQLVEHVVDAVESSSSKRIVPMCWFVGKWFEDHPDRSALLTR